MSSTGNSVAIIEKNLPTDRLNPIVEALGLNSKRFMFTALEAVERNPRILDQPMSNAVRAIATGGMLGLECNPVTGHGYLVPYGGRNPTIQFIPGYKGIVASAMRTGITISSGVLKDGDEWPDVLQAGIAFQVRQRFGNRAQADLVGAWAQAKTPAGWGQPLVLDMSEILAIKAKSAGGKKQDSPWNDRPVGFEAMAQKCPVRRLQRFTGVFAPDNTHWGPSEAFRGALAVDQMHEEQGHGAHVTLDGGIKDEGKIIDGTVVPPSEEIRPEIERPDGTIMSLGVWENHSSLVKRISMSPKEAVSQIKVRNKDRFKAWEESGDTDAQTAAANVQEAIEGVLKL